VPGIARDRRAKTRNSRSLVGAHTQALRAFTPTAPRSSPALCLLAACRLSVDGSRSAVRIVDPRRLRRFIADGVALGSPVRAPG